MLGRGYLEAIDYIDVVFCLYGLVLFTALRSVLRSSGSSEEVEENRRGAIRRGMPAYIGGMMDSSFG